MISRRIARKPENDNYRRLANYIADAGRKGEKCLLTWCSGCWAGDDYDLAIQEVADTQDLNTRTSKEKTYHLIVSFRPEDEAKLTPAVLKEIEVELAKALGFEEHQRHCGVHKNTANLHMHVAYNMIHPERLTRHDPFRDFHTRDRVCRELEKHFGLKVDNGRDQGNALHLGERAATVEAHAGQESFENYAKGFRERILASLTTEVVDWQSLHQTLARHGLVIKPHGNGLVIQDRHGKHAIKASSLDRSLAQGRLEKCFGRFQSAGVAVDVIESKDRYRAKPIQRRSPERDMLFAEYKAGMAERKEALAILREHRACRREEIARTWQRQRREIGRMALTKWDRFALLKLAGQHEAKARRNMAREMEGRQETLREAFPYSSWSTFLRWQAERGNEVALAVLRSRRETAKPERDDVPFNWISSRRNLAWSSWEDRKRAIMGEPSLAPKEKRTLLTVARMHCLEAQEVTTPESPKELQGFTYIIDNKGTVLFTLANGGLVRDMGDQVAFSAHDPVARHAGLWLAQMKWGKEVAVMGNCVQSLKEDMAYYRYGPLVER